MTLSEPVKFTPEVTRVLDQIHQARKLGLDSDSMYAELLQLVINQGGVEVDPFEGIFFGLKGGLNNDGFKTTDK